MKKLFLRIAIVVAMIMAILLGINAYLVWRNGARLEAQLAELRAAGEPTSLKDLARPSIPPEKNAATYLRREERDIQAIDDEMSKLEEELNEAEFKKWREKPFFTEEELKRMTSMAYRYFTFDAGKYSAAEQGMAWKIFDAHPKVIPLLESAAACPDYDPQFDYADMGFCDLTILEHITKHRVLTRVLKVKGALLLARGRREDALASMTLLLRLCRHFDRDPMFLGYLVAIACRGTAITQANEVLQSGPTGKQARDALERELSQFDAAQAYTWAMKSERAWVIDPSPGRSWWAYFGLRAVGYESESYLLNVFDDYLAAASQPYWEAQPIQLRSQPPRYLLTLHASIKDLRQPFDTTRLAMDRERALVRALRVLNALQVKAAPDAKEPPKLSDLGLPPEATIDPFNGQPLRVKRVPQGWLVYSVGQNLIDDGGDYESGADVGIGPPGWKKGTESK